MTMENVLLLNTRLQARLEGMKAEALQMSQEALDQGERIAQLIGAGQTEIMYEETVSQYRALLTQNGALDLESFVDALKSQKAALTQQRSILLSRYNELGLVLDETSNALESVVNELFDSPSAREEALQDNGVDVEEGEKTELDADFGEEEEEFDDFLLEEEERQRMGRGRGEETTPEGPAVTRGKNSVNVVEQEEVVEAEEEEEEEGGMFSAFMGTVKNVKRGMGNTLTTMGVLTVQTQVRVYLRRGFCRPILLCHPAFSFLLLNFLSFFLLLVYDCNYNLMVGSDEEEPNAKGGCDHHQHAR